MDPGIDRRAVSATTTRPSEQAESIAVGLGSLRPILVVVALGTMLVPLNSTMIAVVLPDAMDEFNVGVTQASWLVTGYLIAMASLLPVTGKLGDRVGRRRLVLSGLALFGISSIAAALAPDLWSLLVFRVLQAVAGALILPNGAALIRQVVPEGRRGAEFGIIGATVGIAAGAGPPIGGVLAELAGWRSIFYVNLVLVLPALFLGVRWIPAGIASLSRTRFDVAGAVMLPLILIGATLILTFSRGDVSKLALALGGAAVVGASVVFVRWERGHSDPVVQPRLLRRREFSAAAFGIGFSSLAMYALLLSVPLLLAQRGGSSSLDAGVVLIALSAAAIVVSPFGGRLADRFGRRLPTTAGLVLLTLGALPLAVIGVEISLPALVGALLVAGVGLGLSTPGLHTTSVESVEAREAGAAAGVFSTSRYLGSILGAALLAGLLGAGRSDPGGLGLVFVMVVAAALVATAASLGLRARPQPSREAVDRPH